MFYVVSPEILINKVFWLISCLLVWLFTANLEVLLKFFLFLFFIFAFGLSKLVVFAQIWALFLMSVNSELYWFLVGADTATSGSGKSETTGQTIFLLQDAEDGVTISLSVPVAFFQHLQTDFKYPLLACSFHKFCTQNSANYFMSLMKCSVWFFSSSFFL